MKINKEIIIKICASFVLFVFLTMGLYALIKNNKKDNLNQKRLDVFLRPQEQHRLDQ